MKKILLGFMAAALLVGCSDDRMPEASGGDPMAGKPVVIDAGVDALSTRAGMTTGDLTTLGLSIVNPASAAYSYGNVKYERNGSTFSAAGTKTPVWQNRTQEVTVTAYAPYKEVWTGEQSLAVESNQSTAEAVKASDLLWAQNVVNPSGETQTGDVFCNRQGRLVINFQHKMSKLVVNLRYLDEIDPSASVESLTVSYLSTGYIINSETGAVSTLATPEDIVAYKEATAAEGYADRFEAVFPPQNMAFKLVILLDNGQDYIYHNPAFDFQSDVAYTLNLAVGKEKVLIADGGITANDWEVVAGGILETDDK